MSDEDDDPDGSGRPATDPSAAPDGDGDGDGGGGDPDDGFPNRNALWGRAIAAELARAGVETVCLAPGSRCTPLTVAVDAHPGLSVVSHLDERSAAFFALGRALAAGRPVPLVCTSGTAAANFHPAVIEADAARVPMVVLTADRPRELQDSGANQTVDQEKLYGDAVRSYRTLPEPAAEDRTLRALRTAVSRAVATSTRSAGPPGPVHLNVPFRKPLEPTRVPGDVPDEWVDANPLAARGRAGAGSDGSRPYVAVADGRVGLDAADRERVVETVAGADRGLIVAGPADAPTPDRGALADLARATGFPVLADPLSGLRFGEHVDDAAVRVLAGYDAWVGALSAAGGFDPDVVVRFGASPTSKPLRKALAAVDGARQLVVDPAGGWREAEFAATDLIVADPTRLAAAVAERVARAPSQGWHDRLSRAEAAHWAAVEDADAFWEGAVLADVAARAPDPATLFVSNSMPVRDLDRFGRARAADLAVLGNRGASGIDGITSTALGAGSATDDPLVCVTGDLAYYHDMNGLLAVARAGVDATIVLINNDGGGIFHMLPIEEFDPPFEPLFRTPHGLDFEPTAELYGLSFERAADRSGFREAFADAVGSDGTDVIEVRLPAAESHATRERLEERVGTGIDG